MTEPCFHESMAKTCLTRKCIVCGAISYACSQIVVVSASWLLKRSRTTNFSEQEKLLLAELGREFPEVEGKGYDNTTLTKKAKAWEEILTRFNSQNPNGIKRDLSQLHGCWRRLKLQSKKEHDLQRREARKTSASPGEVSKLVADVLPASVNSLEQKFDDDAGEQLDLRGKLLHAKWSQVCLLTLKLLVGKERKKKKKRRIIRST